MLCSYFPFVIPKKDGIYTPYKNILKPIPGTTEHILPVKGSTAKLLQCHRKLRMLRLWNGPYMGTRCIESLNEAKSLAPLRYVILLLFSLNYSGEIPHGRTADGELRNWTMKNLTVI